MKYYEKILKIILFATPFLFVAGFVPIFPESFPIFCGGMSDCYDKYSNYEELGALTSILSIFFFFISVILFARLKSEAIFKSWKIFTYWWLPLSALFILSAPSSGGGSIGIGGGIDREIVTWWFAGLFFIISLILIIYKSIKLKGK
jgi:preprotein translocase subunit SecG